MGESPDIDGVVFDVIQCVSEVTGEDVLDLEPLGNSFEPGALRRLIEDSDAETSPTVSFDYAGCRVTVTKDAIQVNELDSDEDALRRDW